MGLGLSKSEPPKVVLVPPLFERDHKGRSRMAKSSYDCMFAKPALKWLFQDYMWDSARGVINLSPAEDPRMSVKARVQTSLDDFGKDSSGQITLRYQPQIKDPLNFLDIKANTAAAGRAQVRAALFDMRSGAGLFGVLPLANAKGRPDLQNLAQLGLRFSSPTVTAGVILNPITSCVTSLWLVRPDETLWDIMSALTQPMTLLAAAQPRTSYALAYSPLATNTYGKGTFTASVEVQEQAQLVVSFLHHMAVQRMVHNPFEKQDVVGITNYLDLGLQVVTNLVDPGDAAAVTLSEGPRSAQAASLRLGAAWQANKNVLLKARVGTDGVFASAAFKAWWQPSFLVSGLGGYDFATARPKFGLTLALENYGNLRYERPRDKQRLSGRSLLQRHVALPDEVANAEGQGLLVQKKDLDNAALLGQVEPASAEYL